MPPVSRSQGQVGLGLLIRQLKTTGVVMYATAHPDDENNAMLAATGWGQGVRTVVVSATRGDGGQNEIGPELFDALATGFAVVRGAADAGALRAAPRPPDRRSRWR